MARGCLDEGTVVAFLDGGLAAADRSAAATHLEACTDCAELVTWAAADQAHRSRSAGREGRPFIGRLDPGSRVDRYQILSAVGRGGMGEVYAAYHPDLDRRIALKVVGESGADSAEGRARLLREARAIARLSHPNVVSVYDAGTVDERVYIAMEFVEGDTVDEWLRSKPRGWREILDVFIAAGRGLAAAHAAGVVHRDFKPQNVMIGRDGSVRVMDFGLARLAEEPPDTAHDAARANPQPQPSTVTKTGALIGTLAYMAPEQFRGEKLDTRADQFSFCVALHEALYGVRPTLAHLSARDEPAREPSTSGYGPPRWLSAVVERGLSPARDYRFTSMNDLLAAVGRGRTRRRRRASAAAVALAALLLAVGAWRVAAARRISCAVPSDRLAGVWAPGNESNPRRQAIHRAFTATGRPTAETSWQSFSKILDDYVSQWSATYLQTCEATHVRGEQSSEVLDLRMRCLSDNLDQLRALTSVLPDADGAALGRAVVAAHDLTPVARCDDIALLRSEVPLPRDQRTLETVRELRSSLREVEALRDIASFREALARANALRPRVEAAGYAPLLAQLLELIGCASLGRDDPVHVEAVLHQALFTAEAARDDATGAKAAGDLIYAVGVDLERRHDAEMWFNLGESILARLGPGHERLRAWALQNFSMVLLMNGELERAEGFSRQSIALKERALGRDHPDVAISLYGLSNILEEAGKALPALESADRTIDILAKNGDRESDMFGGAHESRGNALVALGRGSDAEAAFAINLRIIKQNEGSDRFLSYPLLGIGNARIVRGEPERAVPVLEEALRMREAHESNKFLLAETRFSLARALWESGQDRHRSTDLAQQALKTFSDHVFPRRERAVVKWLAEHKRIVSVPPSRSL